MDLDGRGEWRDRGYIKFDGVMFFEKKPLR